MNKVWIIYTAVTVAYIILLVFYFLRRTKHHESELTKFLKTAKQQIELHKKEASKHADIRVAKAAAIVKRVQDAMESFEQNAQKEYEEIIDDAKAQRREIISSAKGEIEDLFQQAEVEIQEYREARHKEVERNLVKMVMAITEKVTEEALDEQKHKQLIKKALDEIKADKSRS